MGAKMAKVAQELEEPKDHFFAKVLTQGFDESLAIPIKYVKDAIPKLPSRVSLVVSSYKIWNVGVKEEEDSLVIKYGWREFVKDNSLKENDILVFKCHNYGQVCFRVLLFDQTGCEKDRVESFPECENLSEIPRDSIGETQKNKDPLKASEPDSGSIEIIDLLKKETSSPIAQEEKEIESNGTTRVIGPDPVKFDSPPSQAKSKKIRCSNELSTKKRRKGSLEDDVHEPANKKLTTPASKTSARNDKGVQDAHEPSNEQLTTPPKISSKKSIGQGTKRKYQRKKSISSSTSKKKLLQRKGGIKQPSGGSSPSGSYKLYFKSHRRPVTKEERDQAFQSAAEVTSSNPNFITAMLPTHVQKRFFLTIPRKLVTEHIPRQTKAAILRIPPNPKTWIVRLTGKESTFTGLNGGWADFVMDNNLEVGDVCLFELCGLQECGKILIDISIHGRRRSCSFGKS